MQITVKSAKVLKEGNRKDGTPYKWIAVVAEATGIEYTTFDKKAHIGAGAVLEIGEPDVKEGKHSFKDCTIVKEAPALATVSSTNVNGRPGMTPEMWAEKDRLERWSRECNTCFMGVVELCKNLPHPDPKTMPRNRLHDVLDAALDWAMDHFKTTSAPKPKPQATKSTGEASDNDLDTLVKQNAGGFYTACNKRHGLNKTTVDKEIASIPNVDLSNERGRGIAWAHINAVYGGRPDEENQTEEKGTTADEEFGNL